MPPIPPIPALPPLFVQRPGDQQTKSQRMPLSALSGNVNPTLGTSMQEKRGGVQTTTTAKQTQMPSMDLLGRNMVRQNDAQNVMNKKPTPQIQTTNRDMLGRPMVMGTQPGNSNRNSVTQNNVLLPKFMQAPVVKNEATNKKGDLQDMFLRLAKTGPVKVKGVDVPVVPSVQSAPEVPPAPQQQQQQSKRPPPALFVPVNKVSNKPIRVAAVPPPPPPPPQQQQQQQTPPPTLPLVNPPKPISTIVDPTPTPSLPTPPPKPTTPNVVADTATQLQLESRASALMQHGDVAMALSLYRELASLHPTNMEYKQQISQLRSQLMECSQPLTLSQEDPLEFLLVTSPPPSTPSSLSHQPDTISHTSPITCTKKTPRNATPATTPAAANKSLFLARVLTRAQRDANNLKQYSKEINALLKVASHYVKLEEEQAFNQNDVHDGHTRTVGFRTCDSSIGFTKEDSPDATLSSLDDAITCIAAAAKAGKEAKKTLTHSSKLDIDAIRTSLQQCLQRSPFLSCTCLLAASINCECVSTSSSLDNDDDNDAPTAADVCVKTWAMNPTMRLSELLSSGLRYCLRSIFNNTTWSLQPNTGSYRYNIDDVAAVLHTALLLLDTRRSIVESIVLGYSRGNNNNSTNNTTNDEDDDDAARVGEFVEAHKFLSSMFPTETACTSLMDANRDMWARFKRYLALAREFKCQDELVLAPLATLSRLVHKLREQNELVGAAKEMLESHTRRRAKQSGENKCNCAGSRRRRAAEAGTWLAPTLQRGAAADCKKTQRKCLECLLPVNEGASKCVACECCEEWWHFSCLDLGDGFQMVEYVCQKCKRG